MTHGRSHSQGRTHQICIRCQLSTESYPSLFYSLASFTGSLWAIPGTSLSVAFPGYQHTPQRVGHHNLGPHPLCFTQPLWRHKMHCHSSFRCWPKERPVLKPASHVWGQDSLQPQPQEESTFCHHRGNSITTVQTLSFFQRQHTGFWFYFAEGSRLKLSWKSRDRDCRVTQICTTQLEAMSAHPACLGWEHGTCVSL